MTGRNLGMTTDQQMDRPIEPDNTRYETAGQSARPQGEVVSMPADYVFVFDRRGQPTYTNSATLLPVHVAETGATAQTWEELGVPIDSITRFAAQCDAVFASGQSITDRTIALTSSGSRDFEYVLSPLYSSAGDVDAVLAKVSHVTGRRAVEVSRFLADASAVFASSLDYSGTLDHIVHLAMPYPADWCELHIIEADKLVR